MKTNNSIIKSIARLVSVVLLMVVGVGQMCGAAVASLTPTDGKYYIIALYHDSKYYALPHIGSTGDLYCGEECTLNGSNQVTAIAGETSPYDCLWLLTSAGSAGQFYISYDNNGTRMYLYKNGTTGASNYNISATSPVSSTNHKWEFTSGTANSVTAYSVKSLKSGASANTVLRGDGFDTDGDDYADCYGFNVDGTSNSYEITLLPVQPLTVTFDAEGGSCATSSLPEASSNAGVTLPEASPSDACESDGWEFAGWATSAVTEQNTSPRLFSAGDRYYPLDYGTSLHAVYRKLTSGTSTATFDASDRSDLTQVSMKVYNPGWYIHTATNMDLYIKGYGYYSNTWDLDNTWGAGGLGEAYIDAHTKIASIAVTLKSGTVLLGSVSTNNGSAELSGSGTSQSITCSGNVTRVTMYAPDSKETQITSLEVTYYNAKFNSNPSCCAYEVSYSESGSSHLAAVNGMTFSSSSIATCGDAASRTITITVTPASGYTFFGDTKPVFTKTSGTIADPTITGPTDNGDGTYSYECTFNSNDNGAGTFAISPGQFTNYRTTCSTTYDITLDKNGGDANGSAKVADKGTKLTSIVAPTKSGYDIDYYCTNSGLGTQIATADGDLSASVGTWTDENNKWILEDGATFYTKWKVHSYTISYEGLEGASNTNPTSYNIETTTFALANPGSRTGYTFSGWTLGGDAITQITVGSTGDKTITANWTINQHAVTVSAADHVVITATPASEAAIAEGASRNVNYNKTVTLNCTPDEHWNLAWDVYKTGESSTKVAVTGSGDGATFTMPDYAVTVTAVMTEDTYHTATFKNNGQIIDGYDAVKTYDGTKPSAPTLTDVTDACDKTDCNKFYGWIAEAGIWPKTINSVAGKTIYRHAEDIPTVSGANVVYHAVWAKGSGDPDIPNTLIAKWDKQSIAASTAIKAKDKDGNTLNSVTMTSNISMTTSAVYGYTNGSISTDPVITLAGLDFSDYDAGVITFFARGSQQALVTVEYSTDGGSSYSTDHFSDGTAKKELGYVVTVPNTTTNVQISYGSNTGNFYFGNVRAYGETTTSYDFTELTSSNTSGWSGADWDGYYLIVGNSKTKALRSDIMEGLYGMTTVSPSAGVISTSDLGLMFKAKYNSSTSKYAIRSAATQDYLTDNAGGFSEVYHLLETSATEANAIAYNDITHTTGYYVRWNSDRFGSYASCTSPTLYKIMTTYTEFRITCCDKGVTIGTPTKSGSGTVTFASGGDDYAAGDKVETCEGATTITATVTPTNGYKCTVLTFTRADEENLDPDPAISVPFTAATAFDLEFEQNANTTLNTTVTFVALHDYYIDNMHYNSTADKSGNYGTAPTLSNETKGEECTGLHYKFIGWIPESDMNMTTGVPTTTANMVAGGATGKYATGTNYYAIWAEEE